MRHNRRTHRAAAIGSSSTSSNSQPASPNATVGPFSPFVEVGGTCLNLDLCDGAATVLERLRGVNPVAILNVSLEVNLMSALIFDQEWMDIMASIGSLPFVQSLSLGFRVPTPIPMQAFTKLIDLTPATHLNLVGLQLSASRLSSGATKKKQQSFNQDTMEDAVITSPIDALMQAFERSTNLEHVHLCRYRPVVMTIPSSLSHPSDLNHLDPLILALSKLPRCKMFHLDRTDLFSQQQQQQQENQPTLLDIICSAPFEALKIGQQDASLNLAHAIAKMATPMNQNSRLKELVIQHNLDNNAMHAMALFLRHNQTLEKVALLRLQADNFGSILAMALETNTTLQSLEMNILSRDRTVLRQNFVALSQSLGQCPAHSALTTLKMDVPGVRNISTIANESLLSMLRNDNFVLETIVINRNHVPLHKDVLFYLALNRMGRGRLLRLQEENDDDNNDGATGLIGHDPDKPKRNLREDWVGTLIQNKEDVRVSHYFICRNPTILPPS